MVGLHVIEYLLRVPWVWGFPWAFQWRFLWVWDGYGDWNAIPTAALPAALRVSWCQLVTLKCLSQHNDHMSSRLTRCMTVNKHLRAITTRVILSRRGDFTSERLDRRPWLMTSVNAAHRHTGNSCPWNVYTNFRFSIRLWSNSAFCQITLLLVVHNYSFKTKCTERAQMEKFKHNFSLRH